MAFSMLAVMVTMSVPCAVPGGFVSDFRRQQRFPFHRKHDVLSGAPEMRTDRPPVVTYHCYLHAFRLASLCVGIEAI